MVHAPIQYSLDTCQGPSPCQNSLWRTSRDIRGQTWMYIAQHSPSLPLSLSLVLSLSLSLFHTHTLSLSLSPSHSLTFSTIAYSKNLIMLEMPRLLFLEDITPKKTHLRSKRVCNKVIFYYFFSPHLWCNQRIQSTLFHMLFMYIFWQTKKQAQKKRCH